MKISHLKPVGSAPDPDIIATLEEMLALAKAGKIRDVLHAWVTDDGSVYSSMTGNRLQLLGLMEMVKHRSLRAYCES